MQPWLYSCVSGVKGLAGLAEDTNGLLDTGLQFACSSCTTATCSAEKPEVMGTHMTTTAPAGWSATGLLGRVLSGQLGSSKHAC